MPPSRPSSSRRRKGPRSGAVSARPARSRATWGLLGAALAIFGCAVAIGGWVTLQTWNLDRPARLLAEARAATDARDTTRALAAWRAWNATSERSAATLLIEAQLVGDRDRGADAERLAAEATRLNPGLAPAWALRLQRLRVLDRTIEALELGLTALDEIRTAARRQASSAARASEAQLTILKATTLAALAAVPDAEARAQLDRWVAADPNDLDAQVARLTRIAASPQPGDPDRPARIAALQTLLDPHPEHTPTREALAVALADAGEVARGRGVLAAWPRPTTGARGPRFSRLQARWDLDYDHQPARAAAEFRVACQADPHDWKSHYGLARALRTTGQVEQAATAALAVARLRERLDPGTLGPRLTTDLARLDEGTPAEATAARTDLATLCRGVGLIALADAWQGDAASGPAPGPSATSAHSP